MTAITVIELRAEARAKRKAALQIGGHACKRMMARALGLEMEAREMMAGLDFRIRYHGPFVPPGAASDVNGSVFSPNRAAVASGRGQTRAPDEPFSLATMTSGCGS